MLYWRNHRLESRLPREISINLRYAVDTTLMAESKEELKSLLMKVKKEREITGLKLIIEKMKIMASGPITSWQIDGETAETVSDFIFSDSKITADGDCSHEIKRCLLLGRKAITNLDSILKSRDITLPAKVCLVKATVFPVVMQGYESWTKESWAPKNWCFWIVVLEKTLESPLDCKEIQPVNPKGDQFWILIGRTDAEASILWPSDVTSWLIRKDSDAGKYWKQEKGRIEDEMVGSHHRVDGHEFEQALGIGERQGSLACCISWCCIESDMTEWLNWTELTWEDVCRLYVNATTFSVIDGILETIPHIYRRMIG